MYCQYLPLLLVATILDLQIRYQFAGIDFCTLKNGITWKFEEEASDLSLLFD